MGTATSKWDLWSTTARVVVTDQEVLAEAVRLAKEVRADVEMACSQFRTDSEIFRLRAQLADGCEVSDTLAGIVRSALAGIVTFGVLWRFMPTLGAYSHR